MQPDVDSVETGSDSIKVPNNINIDGRSNHKNTSSSGNHTLMIIIIMVSKLIRAAIILVVMIVMTVILRMLNPGAWKTA